MKLNVSHGLFKYCQYVFLSYGESLEQNEKIEENFQEIRNDVLKINTETRVFDDELLTNVLKYFKSIYSNLSTKQNE